VRILGAVALTILGLAMLYAGPGLPEFGDPDAPAARHVSDYFIERAYADAHTNNMVTVMIADYRSFDTLGEGIVVFAAAFAAFLLLKGNRKRSYREARSEQEHGGTRQ
jgi:multicomponent Na+:H+ antiporter subunit B